MKRYRNITVDYGENTELMESYNKKKYRPADLEAEAIDDAEAEALAEEEAGGRTAASVRELAIGSELDDLDEPSSEAIEAEEAALEEAEENEEAEERFDD